MRIIKLDSSRWKEYKALRLHALKYNPILFGSSYNDEKRLKQKDWEERLNSKLSESLFAADEKNNLIGMIVALYNPKETQKHVAMIVSFYVLPNFRGKGIGKKLFLKILGNIKQKKHIKKIKVQAAKINDVALEMYKRYGFREVGILHKEVKVNKKYYDDILFEKLIS